MLKNMTEEIKFDTKSDRGCLKDLPAVRRRCLHVSILTLVSERSRFGKYIFVYCTCYFLSK